LEGVAALVAGYSKAGLAVLRKENRITPCRKDDFIECLMLIDWIIFPLNSYFFALYENF
jgi:hypothetical protein